MDKGLLLKILVVAIALLFLIEPFAISQSWRDNGGVQAGVHYQGTAQVNLTIYSYGAFLFANALTDAQKQQVQGNPEVLSVEDLDGGMQRITLRDSTKTTEVYSTFKNVGISTIALAQIGLPDEYNLTLQNGSIITAEGGYQQMAMEPLMPTGKKLSYLIGVETEGQNTYRILNARQYYSQVIIVGQATVASANASAYAYSIPWEGRNLDVDALKAAYGAGNVTYTRNDYFLFSPELSPSETISMKKDYITYISAKSASVAPQFMNKSLVEADFGTRATFPGSILKISSAEAPELGYNYTRTKMYEIRFPDDFGGYSLGAKEAVPFPSEEDFAVNETIQVKMNATTCGELVIEVVNAELGKSS